MEHVGPDFSVLADTQNGVTHVALIGDLDIASVPILDGCLDCVESIDLRAIMLDLRDLTFLDSTGMESILKAKHRATAKGYRMVLVGASPTARRVFELTGTDHLLDAETVVPMIREFSAGRSRSKSNETAQEATLRG